MHAMTNKPTSSYDKIRKRLETTKAESEAHREALRAALLLISAEEKVSKAATSANKALVDERRVDLHLALQALDAEQDTLAFAVGRVLKAGANRTQVNQHLTGQAILPTN